MDAGLDTFALNIPPNFQRDLLAGRSPTIQLNVDATRMTQAFTGSGYVQSIVTSEVSEFLNRYRGATSADRGPGAALRASIRSSTRAGSERSTTSSPPSPCCRSCLTGAALIREREHGTIEHLLVMPVTPVEIMLSKIWSMGLVVLVASAFSLIVVVQGLLAVPIEGSIVAVHVGHGTATLRHDLAWASSSPPLPARCRSSACC